MPLTIGGSYDPRSPRTRSSSRHPQPLGRGVGDGDTAFRRIMLKVLDIFSGLGAFSLGLERTGGFATQAFCEIEPYCQKILSEHWPQVPCFPDVTMLRGTDVGPTDVICGGFPCTNVSVAGAAWGVDLGLDGPESGLWSEYARLVGELRPRFVLIENVAILLARGLGRILADLAALGYDAEWECIRASDVGLPQPRDRLWIIAYPASERGPRYFESLRSGLLGQRGPGSEEDLQHIAASPFEPGNRFPQPLLRRVDGWPSHRMDRLKALGNSVAPQIPELIGRAILAHSST